MFKSIPNWCTSYFGRIILASSVLSGVTGCENGDPADPSFKLTPENLPTNVVSNSGLEASDTELTGWSAYTNGDTAVAEFSVDSAMSRGGNNSFKATITAIGDQPYHIEGGPVDVPITPGESYQLVAWTMGPADTKLNFTASMAEDPWTTYASSEITQTGEWQQVAFLVTVPEDHPSNVIRLPIQMNYAENVGADLYVDDVQLIPVTLPDTVPIDMIVNGSLEESDTTPTGWGSNASGDTAPGTTFAVSSEEAYDGNNSFHVSFGTISSDANPWEVEAGPSNVPVVEGVTYTVVGWYKGTVGATANLGVQLQESPWHTFASQTIEATGDWQLVTFEAEIVEASAIENYEGPTTNIRLYAQMGYEGNSEGEIFFDHFRLLTPEAEQVTNGGLEESSTSYDGWGGNASTTTAPGTELLVSTEEAYAGSNSFMIDFGTVAEEANPWEVEAGPSNVPVVEGVIYTFTAWYKGTPGATANINVQLQGSPWHAFASQEVTMTSEWQVVTFDVLIAEASTIDDYEGPTTAIRLFAQMGFPANSDSEIYFDNVSLVPKALAEDSGE